MGIYFEVKILWKLFSWHKKLIAFFVMLNHVFCWHKSYYNPSCQTPKTCSNKKWHFTTYYETTYLHIANEKISPILILTLKNAEWGRIFWHFTPQANPKTHVKVNIVHAFTNDPFLAVLHTKMKKTKRANFDWNAFILTPYFI